MSVSNQETVYYYVGNGVSVTFPFNCQVPSAADLEVYVNDARTTSGFTVSGIGNPTGGAVTFDIPPANLAAVRIERMIALERNIDYQQNGDFLARIVNVDFNRLWMALQQHASAFSRAILVPKTDSAKPAELPKAADRANKLLGFDANGQPTAYIPASASLASVFLMFAAWTGSSLMGFIQSGADAIGRTVLDVLRDRLHAKDYGVIGDGSTDDYAAFAKAVAASIAKKKPLDISDLKIYLGTQNAPINLDGARIIGNGKLQKPNAELAYLNGADQAVAVWTFMRSAHGSGIFSRYNGAIFTGMDFPVSNIAVVGDYNKANQSLFVQSVPTAYPGWSQALANTNVDGYLFGNDGIRLLGGLELVAIRNINIWFCGGYCLNVQMTNGLNCPIEYLHFDESCSFIYGKLGNVWLNGFRRNIKLEGVLLNGAGQYDARKAANPAFTVPNQGAIVYPVRATALVPGVYGGVNHSGSDQLVMEHCYLEVSQGILLIDGAPVNNVGYRHNTMLPWDNAQPKNMLAITGTVYRLRTEGNTNIDGLFPLYLSASAAQAAADFLLEEDSVPSSLAFVGTKPLDPVLTPAPKWRHQSWSLGDGTAGTFTYNLAINQQTPINNASVTALWMVSANFQDQQFDRNEAVLIAVARTSSGNYTYQLINQPPTTNLFSAPPSVTAAGVLQVPLTLYSRARVTRIDHQPLLIV